MTLVQKHKAIMALYPQVVRVFGDTAYDETGKVVKYDEQSVLNWINPNEYVEKRLTEYPSIEEQLDTLYHGGLTEWKATIKAVKDKYPKP